MKCKQLDHVAIHVADLDESRRFYSSVLSLDEMPRPDFDFPGAWFRLGQSQELHLIGGREADVSSQRRGTHFALLIEDITAWEAHLRSQGAEFQAPKSRPDGAVQIFLTDPDGYWVELCQAP